MSDYTYTPDFVLEEEIEYKTLTTEFESGVEQRRKKWSSSRRSWRLQYKNRTKTEMENVKNFFVNKSGAYSSFTWENPNDSTEYTVRFVDDSFKFTLKAYQIYDFEVRLIEVK